MKLNDANNNPSSGEMLDFNDVMIRPIWPTVSIRADEDGTGTFSAYDDYLNATNPAEIPVEGNGPRMELDLSASVDPLYAQLGSMSDWNAVLPAVSGLEFWSAATGGTQITSIDDSFPSSGQYDRKVWVSIDPASAATINVDQIAFTVDPDGADVTSTDRVEEVSGWTRDSWAGSPATSDYSGTRYFARERLHAMPVGSKTLPAMLATTGSCERQIRGLQLIRRRPPCRTIQPSIFRHCWPSSKRPCEAMLPQAAVAKKFAHFPVGTESWSNGTGLDEAAVNKVFTGGNASIDCFGMAEIVMARGLIKTLKPGEFDALFTDTDGMPTVQTTETLDNTKLGDWLYFANDPNYLTQHPDGPNQGENVIECIHSPVSSANSYMGWTRTTTKHNYDWWCNELVDAYNDEPPPPTVKITSVPGYDGSAKFLDVAAIAQAIFDHRTATP